MPRIGMGYERLYQLLQPEAPGTPARVFRGVRHAMVAAGIGIMLADTIAEWRWPGPTRSMAGSRSFAGSSLPNTSFD